MLHVVLNCKSCDRRVATRCGSAPRLRKTQSITRECRTITSCERLLLGIGHDTAFERPLKILIRTPIRTYDLPCQFQPFSGLESGPDRRVVCLCHESSSCCCASSRCCVSRKS